MDYYGVILRKLRELNHLTVKQAAQQIGRSAGWISQIENCKGGARLKESDFERVYAKDWGSQTFVSLRRLLLGF